VETKFTRSSDRPVILSVVSKIVHVARIRTARIFVPVFTPLLPHWQCAFVLIFVLGFMYNVNAKKVAPASDLVVAKLLRSVLFFFDIW